GVDRVESERRWVRKDPDVGSAILVRVGVVRGGQHQVLAPMGEFASATRSYGSVRRVGWSERATVLEDDEGRPDRIFHGVGVRFQRRDLDGPAQTFALLKVGQWYDLAVRTVDGRSIIEVVGREPPRAALGTCGPPSGAWPNRHRSLDACLPAADQQGMKIRPVVRRTGETRPDASKGRGPNFPAMTCADPR